VTADAGPTVRLPVLSIASAAAFVAMLAPAPALAGPGGGATAPTKGGGDSGAAERGTTPASARRGPLLTQFALSRSTVLLGGRAAKLRFSIVARRPVLMRLRLLRAEDRVPVATLDLGEQAPGSHMLRFTGTEAGALPAGRYLLQAVGRGLRRARRVAATLGVQLVDQVDHVFPLVGAFDWGGDGARFGASRRGHIHQGQDLAAAEGTPVVAPYGGVIETVRYQAGGAGHYVVLDGAREDRDYVFMHLRDGSVLVREGQNVSTGQRIGEVGTTGSSSGPHLHFEVWVGGWYAGGAPIDPLPLLQEWAAGM
jgi:murein DD-endopeptidase MepM/ murein hydrolase activator NlpD